MKDSVADFKDDIVTPEVQNKREYVHRLVRSRETKDYFTGRGWTADPRLAVKYGSQIDVLRACTRGALANVELVICAPGSMTELFATSLR